MGNRACAFLAIAIPSLLGAIGPTPAFAKGDAAGSRSAVLAARAPIHAGVAVPRSVVRLKNLQNGLYNPHNDLLLRRIARAPISPSVGIWPYGSSFYLAPPYEALENDANSNPYVIVVSDQPYPAPIRTPPQAAPGSGYIGGCYPIPNGYHCDTAPRGAAP